MELGVVADVVVLRHLVVEVGKEELDVSVADSVEELTVLESEALLFVLWSLESVEDIVAFSVEFVPLKMSELGCLQEAVDFIDDH